jgi:DNA modification methylase
MKLLPPFVGVPRNQILCGSAESLFPFIPDNSIDMGLTSPPYDNLRTYNGFTWDFPTIAREYYRVLKPGGVLVWVVGDATINGSETLTSMRQALHFVDVCGFRMHDTMIWNKPSSPGLYGKRCEQAFEYMYVLSKSTEPKTWNPPQERTVTAGTTRRKNNRRNGMAYDGGLMTVKEFKIMQNVWRLQTDIPEFQYAKHPAVFPEELARRHIETWSNPGDVVLDCFSGSGTTAKMARQYGRDYVGFELSAEYHALSLRRLAQPFTPNMFLQEATA